ncbi:ribbon-helix-helix domain-containing protein [Alsobacter sp. KACC 23698]|uniref:Ribbon-helix-helix domain-containing protein n=1 Tax=Alsobacter sp. KACC 23698 TaxID=3149229 RepID=A0AAU7JAX0_9HYPH
MSGPRSSIVKRSVLLSGHRTSVSIEGPFWDALKVIAQARGMSLNGLVTSIDAARQGENLSSAIRLAVLAHYRAMAPVAPPTESAGAPAQGAAG